MYPKGVDEIDLLGFAESKLIVYFLYAFSLRNQDPDPLLGELPSELATCADGAVPGSLKKALRERLLSTGKYSQVTPKYSIHDEGGMAPVLRTPCHCLAVDLACDMGRKKPLISGLEHFNAAPDDPPYEEPFDGLDARICLYATGVGTIRFKFIRSFTPLARGTAERKYGKFAMDRLMRFCDMVPNVTDGKRSIGVSHPKVENLGVTLTQLFHETRDAFIAALGPNFELLDHARPGRPGLESSQGEAASKGRREPTFDEGSLCAEQYPFPIIFIEGYDFTDAPVASLQKPMAEKTPLELQLENQVATILLRFYDWRALNQHYAQVNVNALDSVYPASRIFLNISFRSCFALLDAQWCHSKYMGPWREALLDTVEAIRTRWYQLVLSNQQLSQLIFELVTRQRANVLRPLPTRSKRPRSFNLDFDFLARLIEARGQAARTLEHPITYRRALGAFTELYARGKGIFDIDAMQVILDEKLRVSRGLYEESQELARKLSYRGLETSLRRDDL